MVQDFTSAVFSYIDQNRENMVHTLQEFVEQPSCGREPEDVRKTSVWFRELLEQEGFRCTLRDPGNGNGPTVVAMLGEENGKAPILFSGHYDTALYRHIAAENPFRVEDGKIYGSGVLDMKGGIVIALYAVKALKEIGYNDRPIKFLFSGDEEVNHIGSRGAQIMEEEARGALCAFNMETGLLSNDLVVFRKGGTRCKITVTGVESHSGNDFTKGRSAIVEMAHKVVEIHQLTDLSVGTTMNIGTINGGTIFNAVPAKCEAIVDVRFERNSEMLRAKEQLAEVCAKTHIPGTQTEMEYIDSMSVFETTEQGLALCEFLRTVSEESGLPALNPAKLGGSSDAACTTIAGVPTVCSCGAMGEWNHTVREYIAESSLCQRAKLFAAAVLRLDEFRP